MAKFKVTDHFLVPEHVLLEPEEEKEVLEKYGIPKDHLPKIQQSDPCIRALEAKGETIDPGRVIRINKESRTAGDSVGYRVVILG